MEWLGSIGELYGEVVGNHAFRGATLQNRNFPPPDFIDSIAV